jgi:hypothetical protein
VYTLGLTYQKQGDRNSIQYLISIATPKDPPLDPRCRTHVTTQGLGTTFHYISNGCLNT